MIPMRAVSWTLCPRCGGGREVPDPLTGKLWPCPECCCVICGKPTAMAPECGDCMLDEDRRVRWAS